eukprot:gene15406-16978_t
MNMIFGVLFVACNIMIAIDAQLPAAQCLTGEFHRTQPGKETASYKACHLYKDNTCCTAKFTEQLSHVPIQKIGNFSWTTCGNISSKCDAFMKEIECFYQCSPNVGYWKGQYKGSFVGVPLCSTFCDDWYEACKMEKTCAKNWITDYDKSATGENKCKAGATCQDFSVVYGSGKQLCESMWGQSFKYQVSKVKHDCMHLNSSNNDLIAMNTKVAEKYKSISKASHVVGMECLMVFPFLIAFARVMYG